MPAAELMEWSARLKANPWGRHRTEQLHLQTLVYLAAGPGKSLLENVRLPWGKAADRIKQVTPEQMREYLQAVLG